ncbi:EAL domain-containing protein [Pigmentiphaga aceris]|uniref:EAL domain-containing protein n=1 Tax=Pigmentiphaga aceris TaxID=1940612 RepID=A0A5C0AW86_9BURK|nr:EAL domain-containing protein [Pigmentiphaga aceris]QEI06495.1 EAL domain-containing protein [Pigmentiphaga aceris]
MRAKKKPVVLLAAFRSASRLQHALAWLVLALPLLGLPLGYFAVGYSARLAELNIKADVKAQLVTQANARSAIALPADETRLSELLTRTPAELPDERTSMLSPTGEVIASSNRELQWPTVAQNESLLDGDALVGSIEVRGSIRDLLLETGVAALIGLLAGGFAFLMLRQLMSKNRRIAEAMCEEQARARVTLQSIGDAVITTDADERIDYMNPVAERLTQWSLDEARGKHLIDVCPLVDEATMLPLTPMVTRAMREGQQCPFSGKDVALIRRDGASLAIEDSAAPLRDADGWVIGGAMVFRDVSGPRRMSQRIAWAATHDPLTGLVNRREFEVRVEMAWQRAQSAEHDSVLCYLDLDRFKIINDACGHAAGDALLKELAEVLQEQLSPSDTLSRLGGDEFGVLLEDCSVEQARVTASVLLNTVREHRFVRDGRTFVVGTSIGLVAIAADSGCRNELLSSADTACYSAKQQGRNRICVYHSTDAHIAQRRNEMSWAGRFERALEEERLVLYYQSYLALGSNSAQGRHIEILLRLIDEDGSLVAPGSFLPAAERYKLMPTIDQWVIGSVFKRYHQLVESMGTPLTCCINLSSTTLTSDGILDFIRERAVMHALPPGAICFEITETAAINNMRAATEFMREAKALGFSFALDDFGVGTSSLAYLRTLPVDYLKIDGSFVRNIDHDPIDHAMVDTINRVGHIMGLQTVGEYAESESVVDALRKLGVDFAQGYVVHRPEPLPEAGTRIQAQASITTTDQDAVVV